MGDRCYMEVRTLEEHRKVFEDLGFDEVTEEGDGLVRLVDQEANYAHNDQLPTNIPYIAYNAAGGDYGESGYVCDGKDFREISVNKEFIPIIEVEDDGKLNRGQFKNIQKWLALKKKVDLLFKMRTT